MKYGTTDEYYAAIVAAVRNSLAAESAAIRSGTTTGTVEPNRAEPGWAAYSPRGSTQTGPTGARQSAEAPWAGFELVDIAMLGDLLLVAFRWRETGPAVFISGYDLRSHAERGDPVEVVEAICTTNLLEKLGSGWYQQAHLARFLGYSLVS